VYDRQSIGFAAAIFLGSFLLFFVQPLVGKALLPAFGSSASVWVVCLLFFQAMLLLGYLYAHALTRLPLRRQLLIHTALSLGVCLAGGWLLIRTGALLQPMTTAPFARWSPELRVLLLLALQIGFPFLVLAANSTLMQHWFHRISRGRNAYPLYAVSNIGSLLALLAYPFALEPWIGLTQQAMLWGGGFLLYALLLGWMWRRTRAAGADPEDGDGTAESERFSVVAVSMRQVASWLLLSALGVGLMMAVTQELTQDIAPIPFLWVMPLALYLLSFIVIFSGRVAAGPVTTVCVGLLAMALLAVALAARTHLGVTSLLGLTLSGVFGGCYACHNLLHQQRPDHRGLSFFYLMMATGGVLGGGFVALAAPLLFPFHVDFALLVVAITLLLIGRTGRSRSAAGWVRWALVPVVGVAIVASVVVAERRGLQDAVWLERDFYGALRIDQVTSERSGEPLTRTILKHGSVVHGIQFNRTSYRYRPIAYFAEDSGVGRAITYHPARNQPGRPFRLGVIGGGIGTLAAYARPGDMVDLYEINPRVQALAEDTEYFTYLADCRGDWEAHIGDGRLLLQQQLEEAEGGRRFDLLAVDAFNGDTVPLHLLTREAVALYLQHVEPERGVLALHLSNRYLDFRPLVRAMADTFGLNVVMVWAPGDGIKTQPNLWALLTARPQTLLQPAFRAGERSMALVEPVTMWTDDQSTLLPLLWLSR
jgi:hypothetical protein